MQSLVIVIILLSLIGLYINLGSITEIRKPELKVDENKNLSANEIADKIIEEKGLKQVTDISQIQNIVQEVINENKKIVEQYLSGKDKLLGFFVGQVMKSSGGKANPQLTNEILKKL